MNILLVVAQALQMPAVILGSKKYGGKILAYLHMLCE